MHFVPAATQLGYALGLLLLVPLGDWASRRRIILWQTVVLVVALVFLASATSPVALVAGSVLVGAASTVAQQIIPLAAELAPSPERGRVVGTVMSGLLAGILLARTVSGFLGYYLGWSGVFVVGALMGIGMGVMLFVALPKHATQRRFGYGALMRSLVRLAATYPALKWSVMSQGGLFGAFSAFWSVLALHLAEAPFHMGSEAAGLFGLLAVGGVLAAPAAGRIADSRGPRGLIWLGSLLVGAGFVIFLTWRTAIGIGAGIVIMDAGLQMAMISNQTIVFALNPDARNRLNTIYMTGMFLWGALGSAAAGIVWPVSGWPGVIILGLILVGMSLASHALSSRSARSMAAVSDDEAS